MAALQAATTSECTTLVAIMKSDDDTDPTDAQICDCFSSGHDFSALSGFDCKVEEDDDQNVSVYVSGGGVVRLIPNLIPRKILAQMSLVHQLYVLTAVRHQFHK